MGLPKIKKIIVTENNRQMEVFIPETGDKKYDEAIEQAEREKTAEQLRKMPAKPKSNISNKDRAGAIKEYIEFRNRQRRGATKKYY